MKRSSAYGIKMMLASVAAMVLFTPLPSESATGNANTTGDRVILSQVKKMQICLESYLLEHQIYPQTLNEIACPIEQPDGVALYYEPFEMTKGRPMLYLMAGTSAQSNTYAVAASGETNVFSLSKDFNAQGLALFKKRKYRDAITVWEKGMHVFAMAHEQVTDSAEVLNNLGFAYYKSGKKYFDKAELNLQAAAAVDPSRWSVYLNLGDLYADSGDGGAAIKNYTRILELKADHPQRKEIERKIARLKEQERKTTTGGIALEKNGAEKRELLVCDGYMNTVSVFDAASRGRIAPLREFSGIIDRGGSQMIALDIGQDELFAADPLNNAILIYERSTFGEVLFTRYIYGSATGLRRPLGIAVDPKNKEIYVANSEDNSVLVFRSDASGNAAPLRRIYSRGMIEPRSVIVDSVHDELFVSCKNDLVAVYTRTGQNEVEPKRFLSGARSSLHDPFGIAIDPVHDELFVANGGSSVGSSYITVYPRGETSGGAPLRTLVVSPTSDQAASIIQFDAKNSELFVLKWDRTNEGGSSIAVYDRMATNADEPRRVITGPSTGLRSPSSLAFDEQRNELFVTEAGAIWSKDPSDSYEIAGTKRCKNGCNRQSMIEVFKRLDSGNIPPARVIVGSTASLKGPSGIAGDRAHNEIYIANAASNSITVYRSLANGRVFPIRTIAGSSTGLTGPGGIVVDLIHNELITINGDNAVRVFKRTAAGNARPLRTIVGKRTGISGPQAVAIDPQHNELFITNSIDNPAQYSITVHELTASGDAVPKRTLSGPATDLARPAGIAIDAVHNELFVTNRAANTISIYDRTATGNSVPKRVIYESGPEGPLGGPTRVALDLKNDELFVMANDNRGSHSVSVYSRMASGRYAPFRIISRANEPLPAPSGIAVW